MNLCRRTILSLLTFFLTACASITYYEGSPKKEYDTLVIESALVDQSAIVKAAEGLEFVRFNGELVSNFLEQAFDIGPEALQIPEGTHTIQAKRERRYFEIRKVFYKKGHEYLVDYIAADSRKEVRIYYWVVDTTESRVVFGREITKDELIQLDTKSN